MKEYLIRVFHVQNFCTWIYAVFFITIITACNKDRNIVKTFPIEKELYGEHVNILDSVNKPFAVYWNAGNLFLSTKGKNHLVIYNEKENKVSYALRKGHGHDEWIAPMITTQQINVNNHNQSFVLERANSKLYVVNFEDSISSRYCIQDFREIKIPGIRSVFLLSDNSYWGVKDDATCDMFNYNVKSKELIEEEIGIDHSLFSPNSSSLSQNMATYSPQNKKIAIAYYTFPLLFIKEENTYSAQIQIQIGESFPLYNTDNTINPHFYILDMCSSDKYIYVLYDDPSIENKTAIIVFDWNGMPIARYQTNRMTAFTVDEKNSRFIALNEDDTKGVCYIYRF